MGGENLCCAYAAALVPALFGLVCELLPIAFNTVPVHAILIAGRIVGRLLLPVRLNSCGVPQLPDGLAANWAAFAGHDTRAEQKEVSMRTPLTEQEEKALRCLGAAVLLRWDDLPTDIQRALFESSTSAVEAGRSPPQLKEQIARFLHTHKGG